MPGVKEGVILIQNEKMKIRKKNETNVLELMRKPFVSRHFCVLYVYLELRDCENCF